MSPFCIFNIFKIFKTNKKIIFKGIYCLDGLLNSINTKYICSYKTEFAIIKVNFIIQILGKL